MVLALIGPAVIFGFCVGVGVGVVGCFVFIRWCNS